MSEGKFGRIAGCPIHPENFVLTTFLQVLERGENGLSLANKEFNISLKFGLHFELISQNIRVKP